MTEITPKSRDDFRKWLSKNYDTAPRTWVILYKKNHEKENLTYNDVVDVCLCYGWINSIRKREMIYHTKCLYLGEIKNQEAFLYKSI